MAEDRRQAEHPVLSASAGSARTARERKALPIDSSLMPATPSRSYRIQCRVGDKMGAKWVIESDHIKDNPGQSNVLESTGRKAF